MKTTKRREKLENLWSSKTCTNTTSENASIKDGAELREKVVGRNDAENKEEEKFTLGEKIVFTLFLIVALPIVFYPFTLLAILYWSANPFSFESVVKFVSMFVCIAVVLVASKLMSGELKIKEKTPTIAEQAEQEKSLKPLFITFAIIFSAIMALVFWAAYTDPKNKTGLDVAEDFINSAFNPIHISQYLYYHSIEETNYKK